MTQALVTGGSGDLGGAICRHLAEAGFQVIVHANHRPEQAAALVEEIKAGGGEAEAAVFDVTDAPASRLALEDLLRDRRPIQVLVNNAGIHRDAPMAGMSVEHWQEVVEVNLNGFFNVTQPLLLPMMGTRWGRIINISSLSATLGNRGQTNYAAAKAGLHGATKSLARELASRGITVNAVAPGIIDSDMTREIFDQAMIDNLVPMRRAGQPGEVAALVGFLASEAAGYISGQIIGINGGMA